ncbi:MAG TPA: isoprenylcysteine carboxylmethyltransferase family protein, partial [Chitinophagales bacterium]|nr:isoprenylcysteine carboxylmethyltransferase family protein [Chitinophagales bacterium]
VSRLIYLFFLGLSYLIVYIPFHTGTFLDARFAPDNNITGIAGLVICFLGVSFAIWARTILGTNWSGEITVKKGHELIQRGPYSIVRHPIYTGILTAMLGTAITVGQYKGFISVIIVFFGYMHKIGMEEKLMMGQFPSQYPAYKQKVKALIPFIF